ncbi:hypothetical protein [Geomobilimonas luticola]|uniref:Tyr recombinase domain-containing protein n=1 Tax=Geomobilimonas luticola TaxID=1114878 RepID=A0ABS5S847_9BACT|nr:hypothetical protein [Geomobilimonas luticola]MBT0651553.1 hypothetical protein [Geomobilimonas luticola]
MAKNLDRYTDSKRDKTLKLLETQSEVGLQLDEAGAKTRAAARAIFPREVPQLLLLESTDKGKKHTLRYDFTELHMRYPCSKLIIEQLVHGMQLIADPLQSCGPPSNSRYTIIEFVEFLNDKNFPHDKAITCVADITTLTHDAFRIYLLYVFPKRHVNRLRLASIKRLVYALVKRYHREQAVGSRLFKSVRGISSNGRTEGTQGLNIAQMSALRNACIIDIAAVKKLHSFYESIDNNCERITVDSPPPPKGAVNEEVAERFLLMTLAAVKLDYPDYPLNMTAREAEGFFNPNKCVEPRLNRWSQRTSSRYRVGQYLKYCVNNLPARFNILRFRQGQELLHAAMHFTPCTLYPFLLHVLIYSGLNLETVVNFSDDLDKHTSPSLHEPHKYVMLHSYKGRTKDTQSILCMRNGSFGIYGILQYVESIVTRYKSSPHYNHGSLWQYLPVVFKAMPGTTIEVLNNFHDVITKLCNTSRRFIERHSLLEMGIVETKGGGINHRRIRNGYATLLQRYGHNVQEITRALKHKNMSTTDKYYLSDNSSNDIFDERIIEIQNLYIDNISNFNLRVVESKTLKDLRDAINRATSEVERRRLTKALADETGLEEQIITRLMSPESDTYILACTDSKNPTWPGYRDFLRNQECSFFNKCCLCSQAVVFAETLPFIARRLMDLEELKNDIPSSEWIANYGDECDAWQAILDRWSDRQSVDEARLAASRGDVLLPKIMRVSA